MMYQALESCKWGLEGPWKGDIHYRRWQKGNAFLVRILVSTSAIFAVGFDLRFVLTKSLRGYAPPPPRSIRIKTLAALPRQVSGE